MKAKLKGTQGIKGLILLHGEKVVIAAIAVCAGMLILKSMGREKLSDQHQPDRLETLITQTRSQVDAYRWENAPPEETRPARPLGDASTTTVDLKAYGEPSTGWNPAVVPPTVLRGDPVLLTVDDVRVYSGSGLMAFTDEEIRKQRELERLKELDKKEQERRKEREKMQQLAERNRGRGGEGGYGGYGGEGGYGGYGGEGGYGGAGLGYGSDPNNPNRRPVTGMCRPAGTPLRGDERVEVVYWATVVAKVPIEDQLKVYRDALQNAKNFNPARDYPDYLGYFVERAEVRPGKELQWAKVDLTDGAGRVVQKSAVTSAALAKLPANWQGVAPEVVDPRYIDPLLTFPLPPLVGREWDDGITHPDIPLAIDAVPEEPVDPQESNEEQPEGDEEPNFFAQNDAAGMGMGGYGGRGGYGGEGGYGMGMGGYGGRGGYGGEMGMGGYGGEGGYGGYGGEMSMGYGGEMGMGGYGGYGGGEGGYGGYGGEGGYGGGYGGMGMGGRRQQGFGERLTSEVPHFLFRFFDFTVRPGRKYKYRVRLVLRDVNRGTDKNALDSEALARIRAKDAEYKARGKKPKAIRFTEWSDPSATVSIPMAGAVRVASAKAPARKVFNDEPKVTLLVESFGVDEKGKAIQAGKEEEFRRGNVANLNDEAEILVEGGRFIEKLDDFNYHTNITVLDITGGEKVKSSDQTTPARVLVMDPAGGLYIRRELDDQQAIEYHREVFAEPKGGRGRGGAYGGYGGEGGYGGGYGGGFQEGFDR